MELSLAQRILKLNKPFVFYHTYQADEKSIKAAIVQNKSMDLDIAVIPNDPKFTPYLGHSHEYYKLSEEKFPDNIDFHEAVKLLRDSEIPVILDCKELNAWPWIEDAVLRLGPSRCLVHIYAKELEFSNTLNELNYPSEWLPIEKLKQLKEDFPNVTTTASAKFLPKDLLLSDKHKDILLKIRTILKENNVDTVCLNVPDETMNDATLQFFLDENIIPHVNIDGMNTQKLTKLYIGETDNLEAASDCSILH